MGGGNGNEAGGKGGAGAGNGDGRGGNGVGDEYGNGLPALQRSRWRKQRAWDESVLLRSVENVECECWECGVRGGDGDGRQACG